jgi:hypothetical protein
VQKLAAAIDALLWVLGAEKAPEWSGANSAGTRIQVIEMIVAEGGASETSFAYNQRMKAAENDDWMVELALHVVHQMIRAGVTTEDADFNHSVTSGDAATAT